MRLDARGEDGAGGGTALLGEGQKGQAAAHLAGGVLDRGQPQALRLKPVVREIVEILGVGRDLLEQTRLRLARRPPMSRPSTR